MNAPSTTAEQALLGNMLCFSTEVIPLAETLAARDFYDEGHRKIFTAIQHHHAEGLPVEIPALADALQNAGLVRYMVGLMDSATAAAATPYYVAEVLKASQRRQIASLGAELRHHPERAAEVIEKIQALQQPTDATGWPARIDLKKLSQTEPESPRFIIRDWMPCGYAALLAGHGGIGKSAIALMLAVCMALGRDFFGLPVERRRVLYLSCEDREEVLHWRLARICGYLGISLADLDGWLEIIDLVGHDAILYQPKRDASPLTVPYRQLAAKMKASDRQVLFIDGISDAFDGNENARAEVKGFVNAMLALIPADTGAVVLIGHVSKPAAYTKSTSEGYSGSTAWHNSVRARWYLYPESRNGEDTSEKTGELLLELQKSNLGPTSGAMRFKWDDSAGMFVGQQEISEGPMARHCREQEERDGIIAALLSCPDRCVPAATSGQRTAFHVLSVQPKFPASLRAGNADRKRFWRHIEELRAMGFIDESTITRSDRHKMRVLVPTDKACGHAGNDEDEHSPHYARARLCGHAGNAARGYIGGPAPAHGSDIPIFTEADFEGVTP